ncbi:MAG TPA: hypothetical protein VFL63_13095, partial [Rhodanobacteraceae bacterium]|nr:hypothetical protein [Rhodanobacteraceae bacterium]
MALAEEKVVRYTQMRVLFALLSIVMLPLAKAEVPPMSQAELDKAPVIFTGTVVSRQVTEGGIVDCYVVRPAVKDHTAQSKKNIFQIMQFDSSNSAVSCLISHQVTLTLEVLDSHETKQVHGFFESRVTTEPNPKLSLPLPPQPPGHYGTFGIGAQVGDVLKVYEGTNGNLWGPGGIQLVKAGRLTLQMWKSYGSG